MAKVVSIEPVGQAVQECITVSADDGLFVLGNGIITHNSPAKIFNFFTKLRKRIDSRMKGNYYGRAQPLDCSVLMSDETYKQIKDIKPGDKIKTPHEGIQTVISKTEPKKQACYEIEFDDGRKTRCSPDHLWKVSYRSDKNGNKIWEVVTLDFILTHDEFTFEFYDN